MDQDDKPRDVAPPNLLPRRWLAVVVVVSLVGVCGVGWETVANWSPATGGAHPGVPSTLDPNIVRRWESDTTVMRPADGSPQYAFLYHDNHGKPLHFDPCRAIHWVARVRGGPVGGLEFLKEGLRRLSVASGLNFIYDGPTDLVDLGDDSLTVDRPVWLGWAKRSETEVLNTPTKFTLLGVGFPAGWASLVDGRMASTSGAVVLVATDETVDFGPGGSYGNALLHELGHVVGLDHVDDPHEVMSQHNNVQEGDGYGPGDIKGLHRVGAASGCLPPRKSAETPTAPTTTSTEITKPTTRETIRPRRVPLAYVDYVTPDRALRIGLPTAPVSGPTFSPGAGWTVVDSLQLISPVTHAVIDLVVLDSQPDTLASDTKVRADLVSGLFGSGFVPLDLTFIDDMNAYRYETEGTNSGQPGSRYLYVAFHGSRALIVSSQGPASRLTGRQSGDWPGELDGIAFSMQRDPP